MHLRARQKIAYIAPAQQCPPVIRIVKATDAFGKLHQQKTSQCQSCSCSPHPALRVQNPGLRIDHTSANSMFFMNAVSVQYVATLGKIRALTLTPSVNVVLAALKVSYCSHSSDGLVVALEWVMTESLKFLCSVSFLMETRCRQTSAVLQRRS